MKLLAKPNHSFYIKTGDDTLEKSDIARKLRRLKARREGMPYARSDMTDAEKAEAGKRESEFWDGYQDDKPVLKADIATIAVMDGTKLLLGKRRDNNRWTNPGGHMDEGENPKEGAQRELKEEAGLVVDLAKLQALGKKKITTFTGKKNTIHVFKYEVDGKVKPSSKNDPDKEVAKWEWVETKDGLPEEVAENLHSPKNVLLQKLGLQKGEELFIIDLIKGVQGHKYIRKYQRGGKWIYIYHEGQNKPRAISEEAVGHIKKLSELGDEDAKRLHDSIEAHSEEKLKILRELADLGDEDAHKHLKKLGIDRHSEKLEEALLPPPDPSNEEVVGVKHTQAVQAIKQAVDAAIFGHLRSHAASPYAQKLVKNRITIESIMDAVKAKTTPREMLDELHTQMGRIDSAHAGLAPPQNTAARDAGGYGSLGYNRAIEALQTGPNRILPEGYHEVHSRRGAERPALVPFARMEEERTRRAAEAERVRAEQRERLMRENAGLMAKHAESVDDMERHFNKRLTDEQKVKLAKGIDKIFGDDFKFKNFKTHILASHPDVKVVVSDFTNQIMEGATEISVSFSFMDGARRITAASRTIKKKSDGSIEWYNGVFNRPDSNDDLDRYPGMAKGLYAGVEKFLRVTTENWTGAAKKNTHVHIGTAANGGFGDTYKGALVWAKHCFDFGNGPEEAERWKAAYSRVLDNYSRRLQVSPEDLQKIKNKINACKYPYEFVRLGFTLNKAQAEAAIGRGLDHDFKKIIESAGSVDIGSLMIISSGMSWPADNWLWKTDARSEHLNKERAKFYGWDRSGGAREAAPLAATPRPDTEIPPPRSTASTAGGAASTSRGARLANGWNRGGSCRITERRLRYLATETPDVINEFIRTAAVTRPARRLLNELLSNIRAGRRGGDAMPARYRRS